MKNQKLLYILGGVMCLLVGVADMVFADVFTGIILIIIAIGIFGLCGAVKDDKETSMKKTEKAKREEPEDLLRGTAREIMQMHWKKYAQCKKNESMMTCMWTETNDDSAWQLLSGWHEGQVCTFYLCFTEDAKRLAKMRAHRYYSLFTCDDGGVESAAMEIEFNVLDEKTVVIFTAILADIFDQKGNNVKAYFG